MNFEFKSQLDYSMAVWPWASFSTSLVLGSIKQGAQTWYLYCFTASKFSSELSHTGENDAGDPEDSPSKKQPLVLDVSSGLNFYKVRELA